MAIGWMITCLALFVLLFVAALCRVSGDAEEASRRESPAPVCMDAVTEAFPSTEEPPIVSVRWPVPLDDDLQAYIMATCLEYDVDPSIIFAQIGVESQYQADVIGDNGSSYGLMQIYRAWHEERMERLGVTDLLNPYQNVLTGIDIMAELLGRGNGIDWALSYYNGHGGAECEYARIVQRNAECLLESVQVTTGGR